MNSAQRIAQLEDWAKEDPKDPFPPYGIAMEHRSSGNIEEAINHLQRITTTFPKYLPAFQLLGIIYLELEKLDDAEEIFTLAKQLAFEQKDHKALGEINGFIMQIQTQQYD